MKIDNTPDPNAEFKVFFVKVVDDYVKEPTDKKQAKLLQLVTDSIKLDGELMLWFNAMFKWRNTQTGLDVNYRNQIKFPF
tara:strand:- start:3494 stop:3733 length:240 start_codon:yes stop_codon:yes gene_type:complete